jgi:hypothetical protein
VSRLQRREFAFERRDPSGALTRIASYLCDRGLTLLDQPIEGIREINGGNLPKIGSSRHSNLLSTVDYQGTRLQAMFAAI